MAKSLGWLKMEEVVKLPKIASEAISESLTDKPPGNSDVKETIPESNGTAKLKGKKRFSAAAFKVIQQIYQDRTPTVEEKEGIEVIDLPTDSQAIVKRNDNIAERQNTNKKMTNVGNIWEPTKRSQSSVVNFKTKMRTPTPSRKKPTIASVMSSLNKSVYGKSRKVKERKDSLLVSKEPEEQEEEADETDLPKTARFCSGLSQEAQYAMLKCYEDLLVEGIDKDCRRAVECKPRLLRVTSPKQPIDAIHVEERPVSRRQKIKNTLKSVSSIDNLSLLSNEINENEDNKHFVKESKREESNILISAENTQLRLNYRFQIAMDMLDNIKLNQGRNITTPRHRWNKIKQLNHDQVHAEYNTWSKYWSKDFTYEFSKTNEHC